MSRDNITKEKLGAFGFYNSFGSQSGRNFFRTFKKFWA